MKELYHFDSKASGNIPIVTQNQEKKSEKYISLVSLFLS